MSLIPRGGEGAWPAFCRRVDGEEFELDAKAACVGARGQWRWMAIAAIIIGRREEAAAKRGKWRLEEGVEAAWRHNVKMARVLLAKVQHDNHVRIGGLQRGGGYAQMERRLPRERRCGQFDASELDAALTRGERAGATAMRWPFADPDLQAVIVRPHIG